jgi:hypothetical protein
MVATRRTGVIVVSSVTQGIIAVVVPWVAIAVVVVRPGRITRV